MFVTLRHEPSAGSAEPPRDRDRDVPRWYLTTTGVTLAEIRKGNEAAGEPDVVCAVGQELRGIEIVDCWYSPGDAEMVWKMVADLEERDPDEPS